MRINKKIFIVLLSIVLITSLGILSANDLNNTDTTTNTITKHTTSSNPTIEKTKQTKDTVKINNKTNSKKYINKDTNNYEKKAFKNLVKNNNKTLKEYKDEYTVTVPSKTDYEGYVDITASVRDYYGNPVNGGYVDFASQDGYLGVSTVYNGIGSIRRPLTEGTYYITASYILNKGTGIYTIKKGSSSSYESKYDYTDYTEYTPKSYDINFPEQTVYTGEDCTISINIRYGNENVDGGIVEFLLSGSKIGQANVKNGIASIKCKFNNEGYEPLKAIYTPSMYNSYGGSKTAYSYLNIRSNSYNYYSDYNNNDDYDYDDYDYDDYDYDDYDYDYYKDKYEITINCAKTIYIGNTITITGELSVNEVTLANENLTITVDGKKYTKTTSTDGEYSLELTPTSTGTKNIKVSYSNGYDSCTATKSFTVKKKNDLTINIPKSVTIGNEFQIKGKLTQTGKGIPYAKISITYDGKTYKTTTNKNGEYKLDLHATKLGKKTITAQYNDKFNVTSFRQITINKKTSKLTVKTNTNIIVGKKVTIKGRLTVNGKGVGYQKIIIKLDGKQYTKQTDKNGNYAYSIKTTKAGTKKVTVTYKGNTKNARTSTQKTFKVKPAKTKITINKIPTTTYKNTVTITGKFTDEKGNILKNARITLNINGKKYTTKTNTNGKITYKYKTNKTGTNKITATYNGNKNYIKSSTQKTFKVNKINTKITINNITTVYKGKTITITGTFKDKTGKILKNSQLKLNINGKKYTTKTNTNGKITYKYKTNKIGTNKITITFKGNTKYMATTTTKTFTVKSKNILTKITMDPISKTNLGDYIDITGQFLDNDYNALKNSNIVLTINGKKYNTKTDEYGLYYYSYETTKPGINKITATFKGNTKYSKTSVQKTFTVTNYNMVTMYMKSSYNDVTLKYINGDPFVAHFTYVNAQYDRGAYAEIDDRRLDYPQVNKIVKAIFYHKNSNGQIITNTGSKYYYNNIFKAPIISGYTPYKVDIYYTKMTQQERKNWW